MGHIDNSGEGWPHEPDRVLRAQREYLERMDDIKTYARFHAGEFYRERGDFHLKPKWVGKNSVFADQVYKRYEMAAQAQLHGFDNKEMDTYRLTFREEYLTILAANKKSDA